MNSRKERDDLQTVRVGPLSTEANFAGTGVPDVMLALRSSEQTLGLRKRYGLAMLGLVVGQVVALNAYVVAIGLHVLAIDADVFKVFAVSVFAEVVALALVITRSLFPTTPEPTLESLRHLIRDVRD
ncbi:MAG: hypothetical protein NVS2B8_20250 [Vulcanimicrobiaceae bacterium]